MRHLALLLAVVLGACATTTETERRAQNLAWYRCVTLHEGWERSPC